LLSRQSDRGGGNVRNNLAILVSMKRKSAGEALSSEDDE